MVRNADIDAVLPIQFFNGSSFKRAYRDRSSAMNKQIYGRELMLPASSQLVNILVFGESCKSHGQSFSNAAASTRNNRRPMVKWEH
jgi:hypothetical protein